MAMSISTNLVSINAQRNLSLSHSSLATSMQRLSSGLRVNSAKDDAAGLAIAERMHSQVRGLNQAARNANDAISLLQTTEGASSKITDMLQRMRELAVQSINATNSDQDRQALQAEVAQMKAEIDRVGTTTKFNGRYVFEQSRNPVAGGDPDAQVLMGKLQSGWLAQAEQLVIERLGISSPGMQNMPVNLTVFTDGPGKVGAQVRSATQSSQITGPAVSVELQIDMADFATMDETTSLQVLAHEMTHATMATGQSWAAIKDINWFLEGVAEFVYGADSRVEAHGWDNTRGVDVFNSTWNGSSLEYAAGYVAVKGLHEALKNNGATEGIKTLLVALQGTAYTSLDAAIQAVTSNALTLSDFQTGHNATRAVADHTTISWLGLNNGDSGGIGGLDADSGTARAGADTVQPAGTYDNDMAHFAADWEHLPSGNSGMTNVLGFQVGANAGDFVYTSVGSMNTGALGIEKLDISTADGATSALRLLDNAIDYVSSQRGDMGALMSRFENIIATLQISSENATASRGRIIDADFAVETASLSRSQILQQAGTAMVAQANQLPQNVLSLLR